MKRAHLEGIKKFGAEKVIATCVILLLCGSMVVLRTNYCDVAGSY